MNHQAIADPGPASIRRMREVAAAQAESTSHRKVAREIGMSASGLRKFLNGTAPYSPTVRRLRTWYAQHAAAQASELEAGDASAALAVLVHELDAAAAGKAALELVGALHRGYAESGKVPPSWLSELHVRFADS